MCGRYTLSDPGDLLTDLGVEATNLELQPRYNIAPTQRVPVVRQQPDGDDGEPGPRELVPLRWGLVPFWAKDLAIGNRMINARGETVAEKPAFRAALKKRRCLIPTNGFYEWAKEDGAKQPYFIHLRDRRAFVFAGLWESWSKGPEDPVETFTIITTEANDAVRPLHHRMPVILGPDAWDLWLDPAENDRDALTHLLQPWADDDIAYEAVSRMVNSPRNEGPELLEPIRQ